jgi:hypothetical protein
MRPDKLSDEDMQAIAVTVSSVLRLMNDETIDFLQPVESLVTDIGIGIGEVGDNAIAARLMKVQKKLYEQKMIELGEVVR